MQRKKTWAKRPGFFVYKNEKPVTFQVTGAKVNGLCGLLGLELHLGDHRLDAFALERAHREEAAPMRDDFVHRALLAFLLGGLVVVLTHHELDLKIEHFVAETTERLHREDKIDVLHATDRVAPRIEHTESVERLQSDQHPGVARVAIGPAKRDQVSTLPPLERGADDSHRLIVGDRVEHLREVHLGELRLNGNREDEPEQSLSFRLGADVCHLHRHEADVEGVRPGVPLMHLDELHARVVEERSEEPPRCPLVSRTVRDNDDLSEAHGEQVLDQLRHMLIVIGTDDRHRPRKLTFHDKSSAPFESIGKAD